MEQNIEKLYRSAVHLLTTPFVLSRKEEHPQAHVMNAARRGLLRACLRFDSSRGVKFIRFAEFWIHNSIRRCLAKEPPKSDIIVDCLPPVLGKWLPAYKPSAEQLALQKKRQRDVARAIQWKKTVNQARLYRKLMKNRKRN